MVDQSIHLTTAIPWANPKETPDPLAVVIANLTTRLNFGPGGLYKGVRLGGDVGQAFMRLVVAKALCMDNSLLVMSAERCPALSKFEIDDVSQALKDARIFSVFSEGVRGLSGIRMNDLGSIFFDPVTRDVIRGEVTNEVNFFKTSSSVTITDRWFLRPIPGALFELRFLRWDDHHLTHLSSSATRLETLIPRIVRGVGVYLHVASIDRRCLLSPHQDEIIKRESTIIPDLLGEWASTKFFFVDTEVCVTPLTSMARNSIVPTDWPTPLEDWKTEWEIIRTRYAKSNISLFSGYSDSLANISKELVDHREFSSLIDEPLPSPLIIHPIGEVLANDQAAEFIRMTGAWVEEYVSEGTESKLNLLTIAERELANKPHADGLGGQAIGYIGYLDRVYDCFARASFNGIYVDADPRQHVNAILDYFATLLKSESPEKTAETPFSTVWSNLLSKVPSIPRQERDIRGITGDARTYHKVQTFGNLLFYVGGIQKYLTRYFQDRKIPLADLQTPLDWWRFLLEIEFLLDSYLNQKVSLKMRVPLDSFTVEKAVNYFPSSTFSAANEGLASSYSTWKVRVGDGFGQLLNKIRGKVNSTKTNQEFLLLALDAGNWGDATRYLMTELESQVKRALKKEIIGEVHGNA